MFSHVMIGSDDIARSKKFYDAVFGAMGAEPGTVDLHLINARLKMLRCPLFFVLI